jgi:excisionase family DNA binding protein
MTGLLTAREVAGLLGVSSETILRWTRRGDLPAIRLPGGALRYREGELDSWIEGRATSARGSVSSPTGRRPAGTLPVSAVPEGEEMV